MENVSQWWLILPIYFQVIMKQWWNQEEPWSRNRFWLRISLLIEELCLIEKCFIAIAIAIKVIVSMLPSYWVRQALLSFNIFATHAEEIFVISTSRHILFNTIKVCKAHQLFLISGWIDLLWYTSVLHLNFLPNVSLLNNRICRVHFCVSSSLDVLTTVPQIQIFC